VLDPDAPDGVRPRAAAQPNVAAGVDRVVPQPSLLQDRSGPVDRPPLHEPGRVDGAAVEPCVEVAARLLAQLIAASEHLAHSWGRICQRELVGSVDLQKTGVRHLYTDGP